MLGAEAPPGTTNCAYLKQPYKQKPPSALADPLDRLSRFLRQPPTRGFPPRAVGSGFSLHSSL